MAAPMSRPFLLFDAAGATAEALPALPTVAALCGPEEGAGGVEPDDGAGDTRPEPDPGEEG